MPSEEKQEEAQREFNERAKKFNSEFTELLSKHKIGIRAVPGFTQDGRIGAGLQLFDDSKKVEEKPSEKAAEAEAKSDIIEA
jgi:hypothetical protein